MMNALRVWKISPGGELLEWTAAEGTPSANAATRLLPEGAFTTLRTYNRRFGLRLEDHFRRLEESARLAGHELKVDRGRLRGLIRDTLLPAFACDLRLRIVLDLQEVPGCVYAVAEELVTPAEEDYRLGVAAVTRQMQRQNPLAKLTGFLVEAERTRQAAGPIHEVLMVSAEGRLLEGLSSNFYAVCAGVVWTAEEGVLAGITRALILEETDRAGLPVRREGLPAVDLAKAEEAFISSTSRGVLPVTQIDGGAVGIGKPGALTRLISERFTRRLESELEPI
jgi:branched-chain amino acid aminotransferase